MVAEKLALVTPDSVSVKSATTTPLNGCASVAAMATPTAWMGLPPRPGVSTRRSSSGSRLRRKRDLGLPDRLLGIALPADHQRDRNLFMAGLLDGEGAGIEARTMFRTVRPAR